MDSSSSASSGCATAREAEGEGSKICDDVEGEAWVSGPRRCREEDEGLSDADEVKVGERGIVASRLEVERTELY